MDGTGVEKKPPKMNANEFGFLHPLEAREKHISYFLLI